MNIYPAIGSTTISRDMNGYFILGELQPRLEGLKQSGYQIADYTPTFHGAPVGPGLGLSLPEAPPRRASHVGMVATLLTVVVVLVVLIAVLATRHNSVTAGSASAAAGSESAAAVNSTTAQSPLDQLTAIAEQDQSAVQSLAENYWVPIISSKKVGTVDPRDAEFPNQAYTNEMILQNFNYWHSQYPSALLLQSSSYSSLIPGYWVIILNQPYSAPGDVISWCMAQGLNDDDCDATLLSNQLPNGPQTYQGW